MHSQRLQFGREHPNSFICQYWLHLWRHRFGDFNRFGVSLCCQTSPEENNLHTRQLATHLVRALISHFNWYIISMTCFTTISILHRFVEHQAPPSAFNGCLRAGVTLQPRWEASDTVQNAVLWLLQLQTPTCVKNSSNNPAKGRVSHGADPKL